MGVTADGLYADVAGVPVLVVMTDRTESELCVSGAVDSADSGEPSSGGLPSFSHLFGVEGYPSQRKPDKTHLLSSELHGCGVCYIQLTFDISASPRHILHGVS